MKPWIRQVNYLFSLPLVFALTACASLPPSDEQEKPVVCSDSVIASIQKRSDEIKSIKATARVEINLNDGTNLTGKGVIIVKRPDLARVEIFGPFNQAIVVIIFKEGSLNLLSLQENRVYKDFPLPIDAYRLPHYLSGLPLNRGLRSAEVNENQHSQSPPCAFISGDEKILVDEEGNIREIALYGTGDDTPPIKVSMDSYKKVNGLNFPFKISISNPASDIFITYDRVELNQEVPDDLFNLPQSAGGRAVWAEIENFA